MADSFTVTRSMPSGAYVISELLNGHLFTRRYIGYARAEAIREYRQDRKAERNK